MLPKIRKILNGLGQIELFVSVFILGAIVAIILSQVFSRYVMGTPLIWAEELATYLMIWLGFVAASVAYKLRRHITIQTYGSQLSEKLARFAGVLVHLLIFVVLIIVIVHIPAAMKTEQLQSTVGLPVNVGLHWFFTVPTLVSFLSLSASALFYSADSLSGSRKPLMETRADPSLSDDIIQDDPAKGAMS